MAISQLSPDEIVRRGEELYRRQLQPAVEAGNDGKYLIINVETGEYVIDMDDVAASRKAKDLFTDAPLFTMRIGRAAAYRLGGRFGEARVP
jgi:hypothetical protein